MATIELSTDEAQAGRLPMVCARCGNPAVNFRRREVSYKTQLVLAVRTTYVNVLLPFCPYHLEEEFRFFYHATASNITNQSVTLIGVSPVFVEAVWHYRDQAHWLYYSNVQAQARAHGQEVAIPPPPSSQRLRGEGGNGGLIAGVVIGVVVLVIVLVLALAVACSGGRARAPAPPPPFPEPQFKGPQFQPRFDRNGKRMFP